MKQICVFLAALSLVSCRTAAPFYHSDDPFSEQLDLYYGRQQKSKNRLFISVVVLAAGIAAGSYFNTARSRHFGSTSLNNAGLYSSYALSTAASAFGIFCFAGWSKYTDLYFETLRLQTQYYNILEK
jgi:hypothetical protein